VAKSAEIEVPKNLESSEEVVSEKKSEKKNK